MKNKTLILRVSDSDYVGTAVKKRGYDLQSPFVKINNVFTRILFKTSFMMKLPFRHLWFNKKVLEKKYETIIIFDTLLNVDYVKWLKKQLPKSRIIFWYWNIYENSINPEQIKNIGIELWTFSRRDANLFGMQFNPAPFFVEFVQEKADKIDFDISFIGKDKGRLEKLLQYKESFDKMQLSSNFIITPDRTWHKNKNYHKPVPFFKTLDIHNRSSAVLDIIEITNSGQSMRIMESLFNDKKIITNNVLIKDYDFYNDNNIFILNEDNIFEIPSFLKKEYTIISEDIKMEYDFEGWFSRFFQDNHKMKKMLDNYRGSVTNDN